MSTALQGKVAIVTGAASGIGAASATTMAARGAYVVVADSNLPGAEKVAAEIKAAGGKAAAYQFDALDTNAIKALIESTHATHKGLHVLHNNVGLTDATKDTTIADLDLDGWDWILRVNLKSVVAGAKYAIPLMIAGGGGSIINTSSVAGLAGSLLYPIYGVTKAAINALTQSIATQYGQQNIRCNAIAPGVTITPAVEKGWPPQLVEIYKRHTNAPRLGVPQDMGNMAAFLASDDAAFVNGQVFAVDGGYSIHQPVTADMREFMAAMAKMQGAGA
ncbi:MAG: SDR family oxidoreductase [Rhodospirillaceae bacterium]|nr:SDR family oxidoreductase [Rhodospirillaceae bacterium]